MDLVKTQKIVKVLGIINIIAAVIGFIAGIGMFGISGAGAASEDIATNSDLQTGVAIFIVMGVIMVVSSVVSLLEGIFALRAAKDASKVQPLWIFSIIGVVLAAMSVIAGITNGSTQNLAANLGTLIANCCMFYLANNIKKLAK